jgi:membrane fusion protein (multidrug efflux system)
MPHAYSRATRCVSVALIALAILFQAVAPTFAQSNGERPAPAVTYVVVDTRDVTPQFEYPGRAEALETVELRARVEGFLQKRNFREGADVKAGETLFMIERAPYEVVVDQRTAEVAAADAALVNAAADFKRKSALAKRNDVSQASLDQSRAALESARADVLRLKASLRAAQLDLDYTTIKSPINGTTGIPRYSVGNLVGPSSEPLATVTTIDPIHVNIQVSEKQLIDARRRGIDLDNPTVAPALLLSDGSSYPFEGAFDFLAPTVDRGTDTVTARAKFPNPEKLLLPGQFVTVIVRQKQPESALSVPQASVQQDAKGYFVLLVGADDTAELRRISVGRQIDGDWVVLDGLAGGERVIVDGIQKAAPGAKVKASPRTPAKGS